ncbi:MAG: YraN family protein [Bacteroidia bacterium]
MPTTQSIGNQGEQLAKEFLAQKGYNILHCNWRYQKAEVDIIAETENFIVFVEVKTRAENRLTEPEQAVDAKKQQLLIYAANGYCEAFSVEKEIRFDVVSVILKGNQAPEIMHIEEAFYPTI